MSELIFSFLGPVQLSHPQIGVITITKRKALALLTYLVIEVDHPHTRESLLGLLWPEYSTARTSADAQSAISTRMLELSSTSSRVLPRKPGWRGPNFATTLSSRFLSSVRLSGLA